MGSTDTYRDIEVIHLATRVYLPLSPVQVLTRWLLAVLHVIVYVSGCPVEGKG